MLADIGVHVRLVLLMLFCFNIVSIVIRFCGGMTDTTGVVILVDPEEISKLYSPRRVLKTNVLQIPRSISMKLCAKLIK